METLVLIDAPSDILRADLAKVGIELLQAGIDVHAESFVIALDGQIESFALIKPFLLVVLGQSCIELQHVRH